jgi:hypothetical protein
LNEGFQVDMRGEGYDHKGGEIRPVGDGRIMQTHFKLIFARMGKYG